MDLYAPFGKITDQVFEMLHGRTRALVLIFLGYNN